MIIDDDYADADGDEYDDGDDDDVDADDDADADDFDLICFAHRLIESALLLQQRVRTVATGSDVSGVSRGTTSVQLLPIRDACYSCRSQVVPTYSPLGAYHSQDEALASSSEPMARVPSAVIAQGLVAAVADQEGLALNVLGAHIAHVLRIGTDQIVLDN